MCVTTQIRVAVIRCHARVMSVQARHQHRSIGSANRRVRNSSLQLHSFTGQSIEIRRHQILVAIRTTDSRGTLLIGEYKQNVGFVRCHPLPLSQFMGVDGSPRFPGTLYAAPSLHLQQASDSLSVMAVKSQRVSLCERVSEYEPFKSADHRRSNATQVSTSGVLKDSGAAKRVLVGATLISVNLFDGGRGFRDDVADTWSWEDPSCKKTGTCCRPSSRRTGVRWPPRRVR